jgi:two-component system sensor kinase
MEFIVDDDNNIIWKDEEFARMGDVDKCYKLHGLDSKPEYCPIIGKLKKSKFIEYFDAGYLVEVSRFDLDGKSLYYHRLTEIENYLSDSLRFGDFLDKLGFCYVLVSNGRVAGNCKEDVEDEYRVVMELDCYFRGDRCKLLFLSKKEFPTARLNEVAEMVRTVHESNTVGMLIYQGDRIVYANRGVQVMTGFSIEELKSKPFWEFVHESIRDLVRERGMRRQRGEAVERSYVIPFYTKGGDLKHGLFWFDVINYGGKPAGISVFFDITDRVESEKLFRDMFFSSPMGEYILIGGVFEIFNSAFEKITGYSIEELKGRPILDIIFDEDRENARRNAIEMLSGKRKEPYEYRIITKEGNVKWVLESVISIDYGGKKAILGSLMDVTGRKVLEETNKKLLELAVFLNRMLRHDLKNVLSSISLSTEMLESTDTQKTMDLIEKLVMRGYDIIDSAEEGEEAIKSRKTKEIRLKDVLERLEEHFSLEIECCVGDNVKVIGDETMFNVLSNLIENAFKHGKATRVKLKASLSEDDRVRLSVEDDGCGVPEEIRDLIFEYGFSFGENAGSGLGLFLVKSAIERWGGEISVGDSEMGGAKFTIEFKRVQ